MLNDFKKIIAMLKYWGITPDIDQYKWRFFIQKITYISQALGMPIKYRFSIYVKGPYCPGLADDYYQYKELITNYDTDYQLEPNQIKMLEDIKRSVSLKNIKFHFLEAQSTIIYLMSQNADITDDEVFTKVKRLKPHLNDSTIVIARNEAKKLLFKSEFLTDDLKREIEEWDKAED